MSEPPATVPSERRPDVPARAARSRPAPPAPALLERVRRRERAALAEFFDHYFDRLWVVALRFLGDRAIAEEAVQEVFLRVQRAADRLDANRDPGPWLFTIAYNICRDIWRSGAFRLARASHSLTAAESSSLHTVGDPESEMITRERERLVCEALLALPESLRAIVLLRDYECLGHEEIARITGLSHSAVRKRYSRALEQLQTHLEAVEGA